ncbi:MAG: hypothetical protein KKA07_04275, partial [Bacteroidetes bacterium]|nr:hypothetical protein [Bacteroidota bacterium]
MKTIAAIASISVVMATILFSSCGNESNKQSAKQTTAKSGITSCIPDTTTAAIISELSAKHGDSNKENIEKGVTQTGIFWTAEDGTPAEFRAFVLENYIPAGDEKLALFARLQRNIEIISGHANQVQLDLLKPVHLTSEEMLPIDMIFASYNPLAHYTDDCYKNKLAFITMLNFPFIGLSDKTAKGEAFTDVEWGMARLADEYVSRVPAELFQKSDEASAASDAYISAYNIKMHNLLTNSNERFFPEGMSLITHWGLRDELKSHYGQPKGLEKQEMIYQVMLRIINQDIPEMVINNDSVDWNPMNNKVYRNNDEVNAKPEPDTRYKHLLANFRAAHEMDGYFPYFENFIQRKFERAMEIPLADIENLFISLLSSETAKKTGKLISDRLGRPLQPFDIWYDGFKARSSINEEDLNVITRKRFPTAEGFHKELGVILNQLGWSKEEAEFISSRVTVEPSRGAGHAWGAEMHSQNSYLRTRVAENGMDYKGYNIAIHEFGHNVEQTISLHKVKQFLMHGVPNTAFTEALAFIFQKRDMELLGIKDTNPERQSMEVLDAFWSAYEIMGVSIVDISVWRWMYEHPDATPAQLKEAVISISKDVWNKYYAEVFGVKDSPILAIYSHMIDNPLYLPAYPLGH